MFTVQIKRVNEGWTDYNTYHSEIQAIAASLNKKTHDGQLSVRVLNPAYQVVYVN